MSVNSTVQNDSNFQNINDESKLDIIKDNLNISELKDNRNFDIEVKKGQDGIMTVTQFPKKPPIKCTEWLLSWSKDYNIKIFFCIYLAIAEISFICYFIVAVFITKYFKPLIFWLVLDNMFALGILIYLKMKQKALNEEYKLRGLHLKMYLTPDSFIKETYHGQTVIIM